MRLLIDIPDEDYNWIRNAKEGYTSYPLSLRLYLAIAAGTPFAKVIADHCQHCKLRRENDPDNYD